MLIVTLAILVSVAVADLPVHCVYRQILGTWIFQLDKDTFTADLHGEKTS
jgi:hypothetical protein